MIKILALVVTSIVIMYLFKKLVESLCRISVAMSKKNHYEVSNQRHGVVINKKEKKLEADQSLILPF